MLYIIIVTISAYTEDIMKKIDPLKLALVFTHIFFWLIIGFAAVLPWGVTWYVETMGRSQSLPTTIMLTCYPCAPFAAATVICLRRLIKNALADNLFHKSSVRYLGFISAFCLVISVITLIAGRFYLPFYIVAGTFAFVSLLTFGLKNIFEKYCDK